jgi:hypothetical protein
MQMQVFFQCIQSSTIFKMKIIWFILSILFFIYTVNRLKSLTNKKTNLMAFVLFCCTLIKSKHGKSIKFVLFKNMFYMKICENVHRAVYLKIVIFFGKKMISRFECIAANKNCISDNSRNKSNKMLQGL